MAMHQKFILAEQGNACGCLLAVCFAPENPTNTRLFAETIGPNHRLVVIDAGDAVNSTQFCDLHGSD